MELFVSCEITAYEYDCTGQTRKKDALMESSYVEADARRKHATRLPSEQIEPSWGSLHKETNQRNHDSEELTSRPTHAVGKKSNDLQVEDERWAPFAQRSLLERSPCGRRPPRRMSLRAGSASHQTALGLANVVVQRVSSWVPVSPNCVRFCPRVSALVLP